MLDLLHGTVHQLTKFQDHIDDLVQDCSNSSALAMELLQSYTKSSLYIHDFELPRDTPYFTLTGNQRMVCCGYLKEI